ncbi:KAP family NTPase [Glycomyces xiaoerkulensis]|uniref:KAP family NTPase n=1 Tax=Glycomyces xiaoerkulensis TaxID=2038139 RepID=UPI00130001A7|nr:KAP family NTPase [Glycomyces xiaoerkulensis]
MVEVWSDEPIASKDEDVFDRVAYAVQAARLITESDPGKSSIVFGLTGAWGSGKSSMLAMIQEEIETSYSAWQVARFTPWATSDLDGLLGDFYASLSTALPPKKAKRLRKSLGTLAQVAAPATKAIPWIGGTVAATAKMASEALVKQEPWDKAFHRAESDLLSLKTPILLIADDIDRLQSTELLGLLKVVRLLGRFKGVHYLLAYDEATLFQTLSETDLIGGESDAAARFLEKIVQYPLVVPPLLETQLIDRLDEGIDKALADAGRRAISSGKLGALQKVYLSQLSTPRAIDRYLAQLRHHLPLVDQDEINDEDLIILTLLRTTFPVLYARLPQWKDELISGHTGKLRSGGSGPLYEPFDLASLLSTVPAPAQEDARVLLSTLFPKIDSGIRVRYPDAGKHICDHRYFDRYFALGIPTHDLSDIEVARGVAAAGEGADTTLRALLTQPEGGRVVLVIDKAAQATTAMAIDSSGDHQRLTVIASVLSNLDQLPTDSGYLARPRSSAIEWIAVMLLQLSDHAAPASIAKALAGASSLAVQAQIIRTAEHQKPGLAWLDDVAAAMCPSMIEEFLDHLRAGDDAPEGEGPGWMVDFLTSKNRRDALAERIAVALKNQECSLADIAARCVIPQQLLGAAERPYRLREFDQSRFNLLAPPDPDPWYELPTIEVDDTDLAWANRRAYATGRVKRPPHSAVARE